MNKLLFPLAVIVAAFVIYLSLVPTDDATVINTTTPVVPSSTGEQTIVTSKPPAQVETQVQTQPHIQSHPPTIKNPYADHELVSVVVLTRHGDRTPLKTFPKIKSEWPQLGILTPVGAKQHQELGAKYKARYGSLIGNKFDPNVIYARATNKTRTIESAYNFFQGLLGMDRPALEPWLTIPDGKKDKELYAYKNCPLLKTLRKEEHKKEHYQSKVIAAAPYLADLTDILGAEISFGDTSSILNIIQAEKIHNKPTTDAIANNQTLMHFIRESGPFVLKNKFPTQQMGFYGSGFLLKYILNTFQETGNKHKFTFLSGHDGTIICLFAALGVKDYNLPAYAGSVSFELRRNKVTNEEFIVLFYSTSHEHLSDEPFLVWPIADFADLVTRARTDAWETECNPSGEPLDEPHGSD